MLQVEQLQSVMSPWTSVGVVCVEGSGESARYSVNEYGPSGTTTAVEDGGADDGDNEAVSAEVKRCTW